MVVPQLVVGVLVEARREGEVEFKMQCDGEHWIDMIYLH